LTRTRFSSPLSSIRAGLPARLTRRLTTTARVAWGEGGRGSRGSRREGEGEDRSDAQVPRYTFSFHLSIRDRGREK
jgi:hypothetical protein